MIQWFVIWALLGAVCALALAISNIWKALGRCREREKDLVAAIGFNTRTILALTSAFMDLRNRQQETKSQWLQ